MGALVSGWTSDIIGRKGVSHTYSLPNEKIQLYKPYHAAIYLTFLSSLVDLVRQAMWLADIFSIIGWLLIAFAKDYVWLDSGRLAMGFSVGIISYVVGVVMVHDFYFIHLPIHVGVTVLKQTWFITTQVVIYISEIAPKNIRGELISAASVIKIIIYLDQRIKYSIYFPCTYIHICQYTAVFSMLWPVTILFCRNCCFLAHLGYYG